MGVDAGEQIATSSLFHLPIGNAVTGGDQRFQIEHRAQNVPMFLHFCLQFFQRSVRPQPLTEAGAGSVQEKEKARLAEIIAKVNDLFEGDLTDDDRLIYVNNVIKGKLLESQELVVQASNNTKAQFANSPTLSQEITNAVMDALGAHTVMSKQALGSEKVREGLKDILLGPAQLYEALKDKAGQQGSGQSK